MSRKSPTRRGWRPLLISAGLLAAAFGLAYGITRLANRPPEPPPGMVWIPGGEFQMGTAGDTPHRTEQPTHTVRLAGYYLDEHEVTNARFRAFVEATGFVTTAERKPDWEEMRKQLPPGTPKPPDTELVPG